MINLNILLKMKNLCIVFLLVLSSIANAQTKSIKKSPPLSEDAPESVGMSSERLLRIDDMCKEAVLNGEIPGIVALIVRDGKIVYHKAHGMADNTTGRSLKPDDIFRIASQSKAITATAVMMLWEEGKFDLDDPISKYIPELKNPQVLDTFQKDDTSYTTVAAGGEITIRHLLTHTSGIGYGIFDGDERFTMIHQKAGISTGLSAEDISIEEFVKNLAKLPLHHNPGEKYTYSFGLDVLGYFIEVISGIPLDVFLKERLFDPLGMNDTWFYLPEDKAKRLVSLQTKSDTGEWIHFPVTDQDWSPIKGAKRLFSGGGGLCSTAKDYATFLQMYLNGGELNGIRILSRTTVEYIMTNQIGDLWGENSGWYYGLVFAGTNQKGQDKWGIMSAGTFSGQGGFNSQYFADPKENIIGILMKQTLDVYTDNTHGKFLILIRQAIDD
jgi:CubicO group peptidase (beta-lactamase class C family)